MDNYYNRQIAKIQKLNDEQFKIIKENNFEAVYIVAYQNLLAKFLEKFYSKADFDLFNKNPQQFIESKKQKDVENLFISKLCFRIIDLLELHLNNIFYFIHKESLNNLIYIECKEHIKKRVFKC